jgi:hypothetical protein
MEVYWWLCGRSLVYVLVELSVFLLTLGLAHVLPSVRDFLRADADDVWGVDGAGDKYRSALRRLSPDTQAELLLWARPPVDTAKAGALAVADVGGLAVARHTGGEVTVAG